MQCPRCQHDSPPHAKFCLDGGAPGIDLHEVREATEDLMGMTYWLDQAEGCT